MDTGLDHGCSVVIVERKAVGDEVAEVVRVSWLVGQERASGAPHLSQARLNPGRSRCWLAVIVAMSRVRLVQAENAVDFEQALESWEEQLELQLQPGESVSSDRVMEVEDQVEAPQAGVSAADGDPHDLVSPFLLSA